MTQTIIPTNIDELIGSGVSGQVAVCRYTVYLHPEHGAIVQLTPPGQPALPKLRPSAEEELQPVPEPPSPAGPRERSPLALLPNEEKHLLATLAAMGGGPVGRPHLLAVAGVPDPEPSLAALLSQGLIQGDSLRYSLTGNLANELPGLWDLKDWRNRALAHFIQWSEANRSAVTEEISVMRCLLEHASRSGLPAEAIRLGRVFESALLVSGRWKAWAETLERILGAARALGDRKTEAWALHQLGTRALCLDDQTAASDRLTPALEIRESLGDHAGAAATFHNLRLLLGPAALAIEAEESKRGLRHLLFWIVVPALLLVVGAVLASRAFNSDGPEPEPAEEASLETSETDTPPVAIEEEGGEEETPATSDASPPLTSEAPTSEPQTEVVVPDVQVPEEEEPTAGPVPGATLELLPHRLDFGEIPVGSSSEDLIVIISNPGTAPLAVDSIAIRGQDAGEFTQNGRCDDVSINPGDECRFGVVFTAQGTGRRQARLVVSSRAAGFTRRVELAGVGAEE